ncbi:apolipoprotein F [Discoglossus pictus]
MPLIFRSLLFLALCQCLKCKPQTTSLRLLNATLASKSPDDELERMESVSLKDFSWARGNQSCLHLIKQCLQYIDILPPITVQYVGPALGLGLIQVGCLSETDSFLLYMNKEVESQKLFRKLSAQWKAYGHQFSFQHTPMKRHKVDIDILRFNLESLAPASLSSCTLRCSSIFQQKQRMQLKGLNMGVHPSLEDAKMHCKRLGPSCAGVTLNRSGTFHSVLRKGGFIFPQTESRLWLQRCVCGHIWRRSVDSKCQNEREQGIHNVVQWLPLVSGWYNAGSAVYYATQGCSEQAEDRAVEASLDLGFDALLAVTAGASGGTSVGLGVVLKPAVKAGVRSVIGYFKQGPQHDQVTHAYPQSPIVKVE